MLIFHLLYILTPEKLLLYTECINGFKLYISHIHKIYVVRMPREDTIIKIIV